MQGRELLHRPLLPPALLHRNPHDLLVLPPRLVVGPLTEAEVADGLRHLVGQAFLPRLADPFEQPGEHAKRRGFLMIFDQRLRVQEVGSRVGRLSGRPEQLPVETQDLVVLAVVIGRLDLRLGPNGTDRCCGRGRLEFAQQPAAAAFEVIHILLVELQQGITGRQQAGIDRARLEQAAAQPMVAVEDILELQLALPHPVGLVPRQGGAAG